MKKGNTRINICISEKVLAAADHAAIDAKVSRSKLIENLIIEKYGKPA